MRTLAALAAVLALAACSAGKVVGPFEATFLSNGLEQQITIDRNDALDPSGRVFTLRSRLVNRSAEPITVRVVTCWLEPKQHLRATAELVTRVIPGCIQSPNLVTLVPGQASESLSWTGEIDRPGRHTIQVRHALDPEFWGEIQFTAR